MVAVSVALAINKEIVIGFIYNPVLELLYTARKGRGAFVNDAKLKVSATVFSKLEHPCRNPIVIRSSNNFQLT